MEIVRTGCEVKSGENMLAVIVLHVKWKYAPAESQKWPERVSNDCTAYEMGIRTGWGSKIAGTCHPWLCSLWKGNTHSLRLKVAGTFEQWLCCSWNGNTYRLRNESSRNMSAMIVLLMKWNYTLAKRRKWREHVSNVCATHEMEIHTLWESKVARTCQHWLWCSLNGNTHWLGEKSGRMSAMTGLLREWKYPLAESRK